MRIREMPLAKVPPLHGRKHKKNHAANTHAPKWLRTPSSSPFQNRKKISAHRSLRLNQPIPSPKERAHTREQNTKDKGYSKHNDFTHRPASSAHPFLMSRTLLLMWARIFAFVSFFTPRSGFRRYFPCPRLAGGTTPSPSPSTPRTLPRDRR